MQEIEQPTTEIAQSAWNKRPLIISGPCSAETEEQVMDTANRLAATGMVDVMRAGIWKPRTRPGTFEGVGTKGLPWLQHARKATGIGNSTAVSSYRKSRYAAGRYLEAKNQTRYV